ncbi:MAG TPA: arginine--tRNA ligase [Candidatus Sulfotelmatobacter sp.]|nr:arginine--tRNA ligase [Candidatus Sulfotelmatobacter sp.]
MYLHLEHRLARRVLECLQRRYPDATLPRVVIEQPPNVELGDFAIPMFPFAKPLRSAPLKIAEMIRAEVGAIEGIAEMQVAPPGYLNVRIDRGWMASTLTADQKPARDVHSGKILVEHSSINPNKAAHIGHLRNAILGDTFVRLLRHAGREVDIQNYIDNTGVQVADVVVGFTHIEKKTRAEIEALTRQPRFDYYCWDLYAQVSQWYAADKQNLQVRLQTLHAIEDSKTETSAIAEIISVAVLRRHLETMDRLDIEYDFLPRESEILHLHFWDAAFVKLKESGVLTWENEGKNKGCWVMRRAGTGDAVTTEGTEDTEDTDEDDKITEEDQKVIVRSNGTVGYVGKDIAYHMWKFGLLGRDFGYRKFYRYPNGHDCWISATEGEKDHPHFGDVAENYNVIDVRQSEAQNTVKEALRDLGHGEAADHFTHFSYGMVVLTPRCAAELGYNLSEEDKMRPFIGVSGRKGFGVKADDLLDQLIASARKEVDSRHPQLSEQERQEIATQIAIGALRYFMLKYTKQSVIAFDFKEALSFEGETGPYAQYVVVRATSIFRKAGADPETFLADVAGHVTAADLANFLGGENAQEIWELWLAASKTSFVIDQCIATTEPAYLAKHVFQLGQFFNTFYHRHPILSEADEKRKQFLLATVGVVRRELIRCLAVMGITAPPVM